MMDPRVKNFLDKANIASLKKVLTKLNLKTSGNKTDLKLRFQCGIENKNIDEILEVISNVPDDLEEDKEDSLICGDLDRENSLELNEPEQLKQEIERLEDIISKKIKICELKKKLSLLTSDDVLTMSSCAITYKDVEESLHRFSGDDNFTIQKWIQHFEDASLLYNWVDEVKVIYAKRLMVGTAKLFLRTKPVNTWLGLKRALLKEFHKTTSKADVHNMLRNRKKRTDETFHQYILTMQEIGAISDIDEEDIIQYIIDGIQDTYLDKLLLYTANNIEELKNLLKKYEKMKFHSTNLSHSLTVSSRHFVKPNNSVHHKNVKQSIVKCYNCLENGHISKMCPKARRAHGSCFHCGNPGHQIKNCPTKLSVNNLQVRTENFSATETCGKVNDFEYMLEFSFFVEQQYTTISLNTLIDSGSPISFVQERFVSSFGPENIIINHHKFFGINNSPLEVIGKIKCRIKFEGDFIDFCLYVVKNYTMKYNVILGRDFLKTNRLILTKSGRCNKYNNVQLNSEENTNKKLPHVESEDFVSEILNIDVVKFNSNLTININPNLPFKFKSIINDMLSDAFDHKVKSEKSSSVNNDVQLSIKLTRSEPFYCSPRRLPFVHKEELRNILDDLLRDNIIRESSSPYTSPIVLVHKKNKELRLCVDYRELNKHTVKDNYPLPLIDDLLDALRNKKYYTVLDLKNGFHHVTVSEESVKFTSFITPLGQFEYLKMPFGLKNAPCVFQRYINKIFQNLINENKVQIYMDDILVATETLEEHLVILKSVLELINEHNLELRLDKCMFLQEKITYLGYVVSVEGICPNPENLKAISKFPVPQNVRDVQSFIGLCSYFRRFIQNFAVIAKPLYDLVKKNVQFKFGIEEMNAFELLKQKLLESPILCIYSPVNETELHCDASSIGFGAILMQKQGDDKFHPIFYFSKRCTDVESRYHSFELETLSIIYALRRFRIYLIGIEFKIITDCRSLTLTLNKKILNPRISRWALEMQDFNFKIVHRGSNRMQHVDCLSRSTNILLIEDDSFEFTLAASQKRDSGIREITLELERGESKTFAMINGLVYRKNQDEVMFYVPKQLENYVIQTHHEALCHVGADKCYKYLKGIYWFPNMKAKIKEYVKNCLKCIQFSVPSGRVEGELHSIPKGENPFDTLHIDHLGPLPLTGKKEKYIFLVVDAFTKFVKLYAVKSTQSGENIKCLESYFHTYSRPNRIISDRGSCFTSKEFSQFMNENNIQHVKVATMSPQSNGQVERVNRIVTPMLAKECDPGTTGNWTKILTKAEYALNNTVNRSTGQTPSILLFGIKQKGDVCDKVMEVLELEKNKSVERDLISVRAKASDEIEKNQNYNELYYNKRHKPPKKYKKGDYVVIKNVETTPGVNKKLLPKYKGPYEITEVLENDRYIIEDINGMQISRIPYKGICTPANMKPYTALIS